MSLIAELKRRNVFRVAMAYVVLSWLLLQVADIVFEAMVLPDWSIRMLLILIALGFLPTVIFAWVFEMTPEGIRKESEIDRTQSITPVTGRKLDVVTISLLVIAIGLFLTEGLWRDEPVVVQRPDAQSGTQGVGGSQAISVAVLPFANMSADVDNEYFADGISEEILNLLADVSELSVASRTSAFSFKGKDTPIPEIAIALDVRYVLEGSVRKSGNQVRITAQLIDANSDRHLWSDTYDRTLEDIFAIQDEIAGAIGQALQIQLLGAGGTAVKSEAIDPQVYSWFLEARHLLRKRTEQDIGTATALLIRVVESDPGFGRGHAVLGEAYLLGRSFDSELPLEATVAQARMHAEMARSLNPGLGGVDLILGSIARDQQDLVAAIGHFDRAVELEPAEPRPYHWRGMLLADAGFLKECRADLEQARELDPTNSNVYFALAGCMQASGDLDATIKFARQGRSMRQSSALSLLVIPQIMLGNLESAAAEIRGNPLDRESDSEAWDELLRQIEQPADQTQPDPSFETEDPLMSSPRFLLALDRTDDYLEALLKADNPGVGTLASSWPNRYLEMRRDPRFIQIMVRNGVVDLWRQIGPPPDCRAEGESFTCGLGQADEGPSP
jgi:TolB-like protein